MVTASHSGHPVLAEWIRGRSRSVLREMVRLATQPGMLSLAGGLPPPELIPVREYGQALEKVLASHPRALQYSPPYEPLKQEIVRLMEERGVRCSTEEIFLTSGAQQGIDIATKLFLEPHGQVLTEEVTYPGVRQAIAPFHPEVLTVRTDLESGMDVDAVEKLLVCGAQPAFIQVMPDAHNPYGVSLSPDKRHRLVELARRFRVPVLEDDAYGLLNYESHYHAPLRALESEWVFYLGTFSKMIAPALRLGWMVLPKDVVPSATIVKEAADLESSALTQRAVSLYLKEGGFQDHLSKLRDVYRTRCQALLEALARHFPETARWTRPRGGFFVWVELPREIDCAELLKKALQKAQVAFVPGTAFSANGQEASNALRLSFASCTPEKIEEAVRRLGKLL